MSHRGHNYLNRLNFIFHRNVTLSKRQIFLKALSKIVCIRHLKMSLNLINQPDTQPLPRPWPSPPRCLSTCYGLDLVQLGHTTRPTYRTPATKTALARALSGSVMHHEYKSAKQISLKFNSKLLAYPTCRNHVCSRAFLQSSICHEILSAVLHIHITFNTHFTNCSNGSNVWPLFDNHNRSNVWSLFDNQMFLQDWYG